MVSFDRHYGKPILKGLLGLSQKFRTKEDEGVGGVFLDLSINTDQDPNYN